MRLWKGSLVALVLTMLMAMLPAAAATDPAAAVQQLNSAYNAGDAVAAVAAVADTIHYKRDFPPLELTGKAAFRAQVIEPGIAGHNRAEAGPVQVAGNTVTGHARVTNDFLRGIGVVAEADSTFVVENGLVFSWEIRMTPETLAAIQRATAGPPAATSAATDPAAVIQRFFDARNRYDIEGTLALVTDDFRLVGGPNCTPASPCIGVAAQRAELRFYIADHAQVIIVGTPQVSGTTVRLRAEGRADVFRAAGAERVIVNTTVEVRDGKLASYIGVFDASDAQTAQFLASLRAPQGPPSAPPRAGGGDEAAYIRRLGDG